ncbi:outer membrane efflux protein BepC [Geobacter sp. OR-1]|uniref:TolC family protein n=1 Tax=Geobacter sp. OR-1 TaxID=1266765 RepID=UPI000542EFF0|nr:TolC family protein [Geobacter sp. OR-1]GAM08112.1 outer membrane efflux protein BepC [Geobacter sp. OR-1]
MTRTVFITLLLFYTTALTAHAVQLTLAEALVKRAAASRTLKIADYDLQIAGDNVQANRSGYLPRVDLQAGYTAQQAPQAVKTPFGSFESQEADYGFLNLGITQILYDFGRTGARYDKARANLEVTRFAYNNQEQNVFLQTVTSYFRILQVQKLLKVADEEVAQMTDHLRTVQNLYEQGAVTRNNLLQAEVQLASSKQHRLEITNRLENGWLDLNDQIGEPPESRTVLVEDTRIELADLDKPAPTAIAMRPEIRAQRKLLDAAELEIREMRTGFYPELFTKLGLDYVQNNRIKEQTIMSATVGLRVNLFDGQATTARYRQAIKSRMQIEERLRRMESDLALEYRTAVNDTRVAQERITVTEASIRQGEENLRINKDRYLEQVGTATDVIDAQTLLTRIRTEHFQALYDYQVALARVKRARGEL